MSTLAVYNTKGKKLEEEIKLDKNIFDGKVNSAVIYQVVVMYQANKRAGSASTKTRGEVSGGGKKPWQQKGTGRARVGSIRSPLWRHGGITFGPHPRDYSYSVSPKIKNLALRSSINQKLNDKEVLIVDELNIESPKTKNIVEILDNLKINEKALLLIDKMDTNLLKATRNIPAIALKRSSDVNAEDILTYKKLIVTKNALDALTLRLKNK
ncbi:MAG: 50S ribosomal protein L4 [Candidatus Omnitrophota bacterium]